MLSCENLTVRVPNSDAPILNSATVSFAPRAMNAVIGPSGCGKTTLVKAMLKIIPSEGESYLGGARIASGDDLSGRVGFAPQFTCVHQMLTVREAVECAFDLAVADASDRAARVESVLETVGLAEHADKRVGSLSGGQLRRMGLAVELADNPDTVVCDEVTSGLDPLSENSILDLLKKLSDERGKTFICIIHNLAKLDYFDKITVVYAGEVVFFGNLGELKEYFGIDSALSLYDTLEAFDISRWREKWRSSALAERARAEAAEWAGESGENPSDADAREARPTLFSQLKTLLSRRYRLFFRDYTYLLLTMGITFGFPLVVVIFSIGGLPQIESLALDRNLGALDELRQNLKMQMDAAYASTIATGLVLFQVVLLSLIGANNSAREIAGERALYEKERFAGLRPCAYALSKIIFTVSLALFQGVWMCMFVKLVCGFPGSAVVQCVEMAAACVAMTAVCLAFSSIFSSSDKANLVSIYLVGFQLPLSGIVLALPESLKWVCRPFISAYWGWAGYMSSMRESRIYDAYVLTKPDWDFIPSPSLALLAMGVQTAIALAVVFWGCSRRNYNA